MTITNMQQPMQMQAGLGSLRDPRQRYGLGSFVKKAIRGVKKIVKSPLGKMALIGAGGWAANAGMLPGGFGKGFIGNFMKGVPGTKMGALSSIFRKGGEQGAKFSMGKLGLGALGAASIAPLFMGGDNDEVEEQVSQLDPIGTVQSAKNYYSGLGDKGVGLNFMPKKKYVDQNFYAADGGRANYAGGQLVSPSGDGSRSGYRGLENIFMTAGEDHKRKPPSKFDFLDETGPITDQQKEILENMSEEDIKKLEEKGTLFDFLEEVAKMPWYMRGGAWQDIKTGNKNGGRIGYAGGEIVEEEEEVTRANAGQPFRMKQTFLQMGGGAGEAQAEQMLMAEYIKYKNRGGDLSFQEFVQAVMQQEQQAQGMQQTAMAANGGRIGAQEGGLMDLGGQEKDYRDEGGFVPLGGEERADDVPARLSKNEFVFTADAVRAAGGGDIDQGSEVMQNMMDNLEQGGQISEDSQGLGGEEMVSEEEIIEEPDGAQAMYEQQQALQSRMI